MLSLQSSAAVFPQAFTVYLWLDHFNLAVCLPISDHVIFLFIHISKCNLTSPRQHGHDGGLKIKVRETSVAEMLLRRSTLWRYVALQLGSCRFRPMASSHSPTSSTHRLSLIMIEFAPLQRDLVRPRSDRVYSQLNRVRPPPLPHLDRSRLNLIEVALTRSKSPPTKSRSLPTGSKSPQTRSSSPPNATRSSSLLAKS